MATVRGGQILDTIKVIPSDFGFVYPEIATGIAINIETAILSYTVPAGKTLYLKGANVQSDWLSELRVEVNLINKSYASLKYGYSIHQFMFDSNGLKVNDGESVIIYAVGYGDILTGTVTDQDYKSSIWGELIND